MKCKECNVEMIPSGGWLVCPDCGLVDNDSLIFESKPRPKANVEFVLKTKNARLERRIEKWMGLYAMSKKEKTERYRAVVLQDVLNELEYYPEPNTRNLICSEFRKLNSKSHNNLKENALFAIALVALRNNLNLLPEIEKRFGKELANKTRYFLSKFVSSSQKLNAYISEFSDNEKIANLAMKIVTKLDFVSFIKHRAIIAVFIAMKVLHEKKYRERIAKRANMHENHISCLKVKYRKQIDEILNEMKIKVGGH